MSDFLQELKDSLIGRKVFILGGGYSLKNLDLSFLQGKKVIVTNTALELFPDAIAAYWADETWACNNLSLLEQSKVKLRFHARRGFKPSYQKSGKLGIGGCQILSKTGDFGLDPSPSRNNIRGNNSGANAIHLAYNCKVREIILLGYDLKVTSGKSNFHEKHTLYANDKIYSEIFIPSIESMAEGLQRENIKVYNANPNSKLKCFPFVNVKDL